MKHFLRKMIVLLAVLSLVAGVLPSVEVSAAKKKSKTSVTVSTQEELVKALKSGKYKKITIKTDAKISFTLAAKYSNGDLKIVVDAKNATFNSKGTVGSIVVNEAKTVKEYASGNNITVNDEKLTFKTMEGASVEKLKIASETGEVKLVNNGEVGRIDITGESKVDVEQNGSVGRMYVGAAAEIGVTGTSEEKLAVTVKNDGSGAKVKTELPVKVNAYGDVELQLEKGAENSAVTLKYEEAGVKLENNTDKKVTVTDTEGEKQTVKKGEDLTTDKYTGKADDTSEIEDDNKQEEQPENKPEEKEEEQKQEEKQEEKPEDKTEDQTEVKAEDTGGGSSGGGGSSSGDDDEPLFVFPENTDDNNVPNLIANPVGGDPVAPGTAIVAKTAEQVRNLANYTSKGRNWSSTDNITLDQYPGRIARILDFTAATIAGEKVSPDNGRKLIEIAPADVGSGDEIIEFCGMKITVATDTTIMLNPGVELSVQRGGELVLDGMTLGSDVAKNLFFNVQPQGDTYTSGRITAKWGGKITIGGVTFQTRNHGHDPSGDEFGITIEAVDDGNGITGIMVMLPEDVLITKSGSAITSGDLLALNALAADNVRFELINKEGVKSGSNAAVNYFPSIKIGSDYFFTVNGQFMQGVYSGGNYNESTRQYEFSTGTLAGLMAIWSEIEKPTLGTNVEPKWSTIRLTDDIKLSEMTMSLPATLVLDCGTFLILEHADLTASVRVGEGSTVKVNDSSRLATTQGSNTVIEGSLTVINGVVVSQMGSAINVASGAAFELNNSRFECGGVRFKDEGSDVIHTEYWFKNESTHVRSTEGAEVWLGITIVGEGVEALTDEEYNDLIDRLKAEIGNDRIIVRAYSPSP